MLITGKFKKEPINKFELPAKSKKELINKFELQVNLKRS